MADWSRVVGGGFSRLKINHATLVQRMLECDHDASSAPVPTPVSSSPLQIQSPVTVSCPSSPLLCTVQGRMHASAASRS
jgi:hypothetical protein